MRRRCACVLLITLVAGGMAVAAAQRQPADLTIDKYVITGDRFEGMLGGPGPIEWSGNVTVAGPSATATCDRLKVWLAADGRHIERAEATGHIVIQGRFLAADRTEWRIVGKAESAVYDRKAAQGTMEGSVSFEATNLSTAAAVSVEADRLLYDVAARRFRFEGVERPVRGQWQEPAEEQPPDGGSGETEGGKAGSEP